MNEELEKKIYKRTQRLQGSEWHKKKDRVFMVGHKIHNNNTDGGIRVKGFYKDIDKDGVLYTHWMNDHEIAEFLLSFEDDNRPVSNDLKEMGLDGNDVHNLYKYTQQIDGMYKTQFEAMRKNIDIMVDALNNVQQHIKDKIRKSFEVDWGISDKLSDRLMTETVVELQIIEQMINEALNRKGE